MQKSARTSFVHGTRGSRSRRHHHEHYDGSGYPDGLSRNAIPVCARIISIADSYDAMAVTWSYHRARRHEEIMAILQKENGIKLYQELMEIFFGIIGHSPYRAN
ncbi:MAG: HD domain-containing protein [Burkholderiales bacterium]|nr:HD domain-containing protein [Burkholderiales bacterium]